jgi:hypothetical protein
MGSLERRLDLVVTLQKNGRTNSAFQPDILARQRVRLETKQLRPPTTIERAHFL